MISLTLSIYCSSHIPYGFFIKPLWVWCRWLFYCLQILWSYMKPIWLEAGQQALEQSIIHTSLHVPVRVRDHAFVCKQWWPKNTCWTEWLFSYFNLHLFEPKKEIRVKSTKLKYKNKGLKLKSIYEYNFHIHPVLWSRMTALWEWQYSCYGKRGALTSQMLCLGNCHLGLSEVYGLMDLCYGQSRS